MERKLGETSKSEETEAPKEELKADTKVNFDFQNAQREFEDTGELSQDTISSLVGLGFLLNKEVSEIITPLVQYPH